MPMVQAYAQELLNQKESRNGTESASYASDALFEATERLMAALDRLENKVHRAAVEHASQKDTAFFEQENEALRQERETLNATLTQLQQEYGDLQDVATAIYRKLNDSIKRLNSIIGD